MLRRDRGVFGVTSTLARIRGLAVSAVGAGTLLYQPLRGYADWIEQSMPQVAFMGVGGDAWGTGL
jgi:hypothetical protein